MENSKRLILFVAPTAFEYQAVRRGLAGYRGQGQVRLEMCGMGPFMAQRFCQGLDAQQVACLVLVGWAGGLTPEMVAGKLVCATEARMAGKPAIACQVLAMAGVKPVVVLTAPTALSTPAEKAAAAAGGMEAVEMEGYPMAAWAAQNSVPFIHLRLILDAVDEPLPDLGNALDEYSRLRPLVFLGRLLAHPGILRSLGWLNTRVRELNPSLERLAQSAAQVLLGEDQ